MDRLIQAISRRVNPGGVLEVTIRPLGDNQIEVIIPEADREEVERLKRKISAAGTSNFVSWQTIATIKPLLSRRWPEKIESFGTLKVRSWLGGFQWLGDRG